MCILNLFKKREKKPFEFPKCKPIPMPIGIKPPKKESTDIFDHIYEFKTNVKSKQALVVKLDVGTKIECSHEAFENIIKDDYVQEFFTLNIKILENNRYSIYFDEKKELFIKWC